MVNRIAGDHYLVLLLPIDFGTTILMDGKDLNSPSVGRCTGTLAGHVSPRHCGYVFHFSLSIKTWSSLQKSQGRIVED